MPVLHGLAATGNPGGPALEAPIQMQTDESAPMQTDAKRKAEPDADSIESLMAVVRAGRTKGEGKGFIEKGGKCTKIENA